MIETKLDMNDFNIDMSDNPNAQVNIAVVGLGATGSAFMILLAHLLKYVTRYTVTLFDFDSIEEHNKKVSTYGFYDNLNLEEEMKFKASSSLRILERLLGTYSIERNKHILRAYSTIVTNKLLTEMFTNTNLNYIFIFTDNNESRYEMSQYQLANPHTKVFDCRIGSYDQFEVYYSNNPTKYAKTIYMNDDNTPRHLDNRTNVCLDDRMSFSVAMASSSLLMNLFQRHLRDDIKDDFHHIMIGNDYLGVITGY